MPGNIRSAEQAGKGQVGMDQSKERSERDAALNGKPAAKPLYVIHSMDMPRGPLAMEYRPRKSPGMLDRSVQGQIGRMLRDVFSDVAEEPVPERFIKLLEALEHKEKQP